MAFVALAAKLPVDIRNAIIRLAVNLVSRMMHVCWHVVCMCDVARSYRFAHHRVKYQIYVGSNYMNTHHALRGWLWDLIQSPRWLSHRSLRIAGYGS